MSLACPPTPRDVAHNSACALTRNLTCDPLGSQAVTQSIELHQARAWFFPEYSASFTKTTMFALYYFSLDNIWIHCIVKRINWYKQVQEQTNDSWWLCHPVVEYQSTLLFVSCLVCSRHLFLLPRGKWALVNSASWLGRKHFRMLLPYIKISNSTNWALDFFLNGKLGCFNKDQTSSLLFLLDFLFFLSRSY